MNEENSRFLTYKKILLEIIHHHLPLCKVYLFGSRARGTHREGADIDLALDCQEPINLSIIMKIQDAIEETMIPLMVDLVDLYTATDKLKNEVKKEGVLWEH